MTIDQPTAASIDLGSNTFRLLVATCSAGSLHVLEKKLATVRLGGKLQDKQLQEQAMEKGLEVLRIFRENLNMYQPQNIRICGTEALRQAKNSKLFLKRAEKILQNKIDIITGEEEALLSLAGVLSGFETKALSGNFLLADVGGGSTELLLADASTGQTRIESIGLGVVGLTEKYLSRSQPEIATMDAFLVETVANGIKKLQIPEKKPEINIIGCGGTATSMAALDLNLSTYNESLIQGHRLQHARMEKLWSKLMALPAHKRNELPCLGEGRGEILPAGLRIYQVLLKILQQNEMKVSDTGLLEGILLSSISDNPEMNCSRHNFIPES